MIMGSKYGNDESKDGERHRYAPCARHVEFVEPSQTRETRIEGHNRDVPAELCGDAAARESHAAEVEKMDSGWTQRSRSRRQRS